MLNKVTLQGRLVRDPEIRHTPSGTAVTQIRMAVDRDYKNKETRERKADFIPVVLWRGDAEFVARHFRKGDPIIIEGRLASRDYTDRDGKNRTTMEVHAENAYFSEASGRRMQPAPAYTQNYNRDYSIPDEEH